MVSRAAARSRAASGSPASARISAVSSASRSKNGTSRPFTPSRTTSRTGWVSDATTSAPAAIASVSDQLSTNG